MRTTRILTRILFGAVVLLLVVAAGFTVWAYTPLGPMAEATAALQSDAKVQVTSSSWLTFRPTDSQPTAGFIIYPGGRVDPRSYAPTARTIAEHGYLVVITPEPFNLAVFKPTAAQAVIDAHPEIRRWAIGGHSLGGAMAANFVYTHPDAVQALILWAAFPAGNNSLSDRRLPVVSIYGTNDGLGAQGFVGDSRSLLPPETHFVPIEGGNHAQMGWYGLQGGDGTASISREAQQAQVVDATLALLARLNL